MDISFDHAGPVMVAKINGELSIEHLSPFLDEFSDLPGRGITAVVLDLAEIDFMGSTALSVIIALNRSLAQSKIKAVLCSPSEGVAQVLAMTRLDKALEVYPNRQAALESLGGDKTKG